MTDQDPQKPPANAPQPQTEPARAGKPDDKEETVKTPPPITDYASL